MQVLLILHNLLRWLILLFAFWTLLSALSGLISKKEYTVNDGRSNFFFMLSMDIQLLTGLALYFMNGWFNELKNLSEKSLQQPMVRFFTVEHAFMMIVAWILVHLGRVSVKKATTSNSKYIRTLVFFGIALILILIAIPWPWVVGAILRLREAVDRPWFRWF